MMGRHWSFVLAAESFEWNTESKLTSCNFNTSHRLAAKTCIVLVDSRMDVCRFRLGQVKMVTPLWLRLSTNTR